MKLRSNKTQLRKFQKNAKLKKGNFDENFDRKGRRDGRLNLGPADINDTHPTDAVLGTLRIVQSDNYYEYKFLDPWYGSFRF